MLKIKSKIKLYIFAFIIVLILVGVFIFKMGGVQIIENSGIFLEGTINPVSFDSNDTREIGYEFLDDGNVVHIWNTKDDYFFNKSSGIQFTNHFQDYWTRNIFCIGYYSGETWNKIYCADELSNFNRNIETDNLTYVNATLWKDVSYGSYDLRLGIQYYLGLEDNRISIKVYAKNIGSDIPFDLGFAWKIKDVEIPDGINDIIKINQEQYMLNDTYDLLFTDMNRTNLEIRNDKKFLWLGWEKSVNYAVKMFGNGNQEDFYVMLLINAGHFNPNQEKSTMLYWIDAPITATNEDATDEFGDDTSITTTNSFALDSGKVYFLWVFSRRSGANPSRPTVTDWTFISESINPIGEDQGVTLFYRVGAGESATTYTADWGAETQESRGIIVDEFTGVDTTDPTIQEVGDGGGSGHPTITLASFADATNNAPYMATRHGWGAALTEEAGYTILGDGTGLASEFQVGEELTPMFTAGDTGQRWIAMGVEVNFAGVADNSPQWQDNSTNSTLAGEPVQHIVNWTDDDSLFGYIFSYCNGTYGTGGGSGTAHYNYSDLVDNTAFNGTGQNADMHGGTEAVPQTYTDLATDNTTYAVVTSAGNGHEPFWRFNLTIDDTVADIQWIYVLVNGFESANTETATIYFFNHSTSAWESGIGDLPGSDGDVSNNFTGGFDTLVGANDQITITVRGLAFDSGESMSIDFVQISVGTEGSAIASCFDANPTFTNESFVTMTGTGNWSNVTIITNSTVGSTIKWRFYANDSANNWNATDLFIYNTTAAAADTCSCPSINTNWELDLTDSCQIWTDCDIGYGNISFVNTGTAEFNATITAKNMNPPPDNGGILYIGGQCVVNLG